MNNIEILEEQLNYWKDLIKRTEISNPIYTWIKDDKIEQKIKAIENLIQENKELKEIRDSLLWQKNFDTKILDEDYIPKSKVKEVMQGLNRNIAAVNDNSSENYKYAKKMLQELIEGVN